METWVSIGLMIIIVIAFAVEEYLHYKEEKSYKKDEHDEHKGI